MDFIVKYWAQLTVLIGVIGYALKGLFDFRLKKLEIKYSLLFKERLSAVSNFFHLVNTLKDETGGLIEGILDGEQISLEEEKTNTFESYSKALNYAVILVPVNVSDYMYEIDDAIMSLDNQYHDLYMQCVTLYPLPIKLDTNAIEFKRRIVTDNSLIIFEKSIAIVEYLQKEMGIK